MSAKAHLRLAGLMIGVCAAYYVGSHIGLALRIPPATTSVMWPPNTVLTLALMLTPPARWLWCLAAALSAHFAVQGGTGWPAPLVIALFATNSLEAVLAAGGLRWLSGPQPRIDSLRRMGALIAVAGLAAPVLSSFPDAALVSWFQGEPFVLVMRRRVVSNVLSALTLLPALLALVLHTSRWARQSQPARRAEAAALGVGLLVATSLAFLTTPTPVTGLSGLAPTPLVIVLPFLLWAALRFGTAGASLALLLTAMTAVQGAISRVHATDIATAEEAVLAVQIFLIMLSLPLLGCAALVEERYHARNALADRLRFEAMLARLSATFVGVPASSMHDAFSSAVGRLGRFLGVDAIVLVERTPAGATPPLAVWAHHDAMQQELASVVDALPVVIGELLREREVVEDRVEASVAIAPAEAGWLRGLGLTRLLALPVWRGPRLVGGLLLLGGDPHEAWSADRIDRVRQAAAVLGQALDHWRSDEALRESESVKAAILAAIPTGVAVLARDGRIASVNPQWDAAWRERGLVTLAGAAAGGFLDLCRAARLAGLPAADDAREGVAAVLEGRRAQFVLDYCAAPATLDRWFTLSAVPLAGPDGGAVLTHAETTERRRAELSAQRSRDELAHLTRVSAMGELASSLAQRLHQPLSGIVRGAEAARQLLARSRPDLRSLDALLKGIVEDDRRAREVIEQLRDLLRKSVATRSSVDVNAVVEEIVMLLQTDAANRHVQIEVALSLRPLVIEADRVQLAQVLLNLALNAMEAMATMPLDQRQLRISTEGGYDAAMVMVADSGPGLGPNPEALFEPFYTTKASGMGMGLAIARTIVEAHGGRVWGATIPGRTGATFFVSLPLADERTTMGQSAGGPPQERLS